MPALLTKETGGTKYPLLIDGMTFSKMPKDLEFTPTPASDYQDLMSGRSRSWSRRPSFDGVADMAERFTLSFSYAWVRGLDRVNFLRMRARGDAHLFVLWQMNCVRWTCRTGVQRMYLPGSRLIAPHVYSGTTLADANGTALVNTTNFPAEATLNGEPLTVTYAEGPTLDDPGASGIVLAKQADVTGDASGYAAVLAGDDVATGDVLELWAVFAIEMQLHAPQIPMQGEMESHSYTFVET